MSDTSLSLPDLYEASITELRQGLENEIFTSVHLVKAYLARIEEVNINGAGLRAVIETNPKALCQAAKADEQRKTKHSGDLGALHGIPILLKDNMATVHDEGMNTTAGSFALLGSVVPRDATITARLRNAGAIILGKTNTSEWANFRGKVPSGFSGRGGQTTCPYYANVGPSGSSSGSAVAVAIGLAAAAIGSETDGSIVMPGSRNNVVGIKPTVGLTSRAGVIPISSNQDSIGPLTRSVRDSAILLAVLAGADPLDPPTLAQPQPIPDYTTALSVDALKGARIGIPRKFQGIDEDIIEAFNDSVAIIRGLGAELIDPAEFDNAEELLAAGLSNSGVETVILSADFKDDLNMYLDGLVQVPTGVKCLADIISFNKEHASEELIPPYYDDQSQLIVSEASTKDKSYHDALDIARNMSRTMGIDANFKKFNLDAMLIPTEGFASTPAALAGYPIVTVPLGFRPDNTIPTHAPRNPTLSKAAGVPFGLSFTGMAWTEYKLLGYAYAYEHATKHRLQRRAYEKATPKTQLIDII